MPRFQLGPFAWILTVLLFASAVRAEDLHFKKNISFAGSPVSSSEVWIKGARERSLNSLPTGNVVSRNRADRRRLRRREHLGCEQRR